MEILLKRRFLGKKYTIGTLFIDSVRFCDTLELPVRDVNKNGVFDGEEKKVYGDTAIPYGEYEGVVTISPRFKRMLLRVKDVSEFEGVLFHRGNTIKDTLGCVLVGENKKKGMVLNSTKHELELTEKALKAQNNNEKIKIIVA